MNSKQQMKSDDLTISEQLSSQTKGGDAKESERRADPARAIQRARLNPGSLAPHDVLQLQRTIGNRAVNQLLTGSERSRPNVQSDGGRSASNSQAAAGLLPGVGPDEKSVLVGGSTVGEFLGDIGRPIGTVVGNVVGAVASAFAGNSISSTTNTGPTWNNNGNFDWRVGFTTTGVNGWIVQEITNTYRAEDNTGNDVTPAHTPHYWEAWAVDGASNITPNVGADNDYWIRPDLGANTEGHWSMSASLYFTTTDPATQGFAAGNVIDAGILLSANAAPAGLGVARLHRYAQGSWDSTGAVPTHTGSAL